MGNKQGRLAENNPVAVDDAAKHPVVTAEDIATLRPLYEAIAVQYPPIQFRIYADRIGDIIRRDQDFAYLPERERIGGGSLSSGVFQEKSTGALWLGKIHHPPFKDHARGILDLEQTESIACTEKISNDIYAYYGANVASIELSEQKMMNTGLDEDNPPTRPAVHAMSKLVPKAEAYETIPNFRCHQPNPEGFLTLTEKLRLPERGLGGILAVADFINDIDVIGIGGGNILYTISPDGWVDTVKIDPGYAFTTIEDEESPQTVPPQFIRVAHPCFVSEKPNIISFADLPHSTRFEYLMTLHLIARTNDATIKGFFTRKGGEKFTVYSKRSIESYCEQLIIRRKKLRKDYAVELEATRLIFESRNLATALMPNTEPVIQDEFDALLQQLSFYIPPHVQALAKAQPQGALVPWQKTLDSFLAHSQQRVMLLTGESGGGKSLSLLKLKEDCLQAFRANARAPQVLHVELKRFNQAQEVRQCIQSAIQKAHAGTLKEWQTRSAILLLDGYDEVSGDMPGNLYLSNQLATWRQLKVIITCRNQALQEGYENNFAPMDERGQIQQAAFCQYQIAPFDAAQIKGYLIRYVSQHQGTTVENYQARMASIPGLNDLIRVPLLLRIAVEALPQLEEQQRIREAFLSKTSAVTDAVGVSSNPSLGFSNTMPMLLTRARLYEAFMWQWFANQTVRLKDNPALKELAEPMQIFNHLSQRLALAMIGADQFQIQHSAAETSLPHAAAASAAGTTIPLISPLATFLNDPACQGCPLQKDEFIHRSFLEYFAARGIWDALIQPHSTENATHLVQKGLRPDFILNEPAVIDFLKEMSGDAISSQNPRGYIPHFFGWMTRTREAKTLEDIQASACAATLLNALQQPFNQIDLKGVNITGADLSNALLRDTQFQQANLARTHLRGASFSQAQFQEANLRDMQCGQNLIFKIKGLIRCMILNPKEPLIAIGFEKSIVIWDITTRRIKTELRKDEALKPHNHPTINKIDAHFGRDTDSISSLAFSHDGKILLAGYEKMFCLWDVDSRQEVKCIKVQGNTDSEIREVAFSPNGKYILSGDWDKTVRLWEISSAREIRCFKERTEGIGCIAFSPDGRTFLSGSRDTTVRLWNVDSGREIRCFKGHTEGIGCIAFSADGRTFLSGSSDKTVRLWNVDSGREIRCFKGHTDEVMDVKFYPTGYYAASVCRDKTIRFWHLDSASEIAHYVGHTEMVKSIAFSLDGRHLISASLDQTLRFWDVTLKPKIRDFSGHSDSVTSLAFLSNQQILVSASADKTIRLWHVGEGREIHRFEGHTEKIRSVALSPNGSYLASASDDKTLRLWDMDHRCEIQAFETPKNLLVTSIVFSSDGRHLISGSGGFHGKDTVHVWEVASRKLVRRLNGHMSWVRSVIVSSDGKYIASGGGSGNFKSRFGQLTGFTTDSENSPLTVNNPSFQHFLASDNEFPPVQYLYNDDNTVRLWDTALGQEIRCFKGHTDLINSVVFSPDGQTLLSGSDDNTLRLWDIVSGDEIRCFEGHTNQVTSIAFSSDGQTLLSGSVDQTVRFWDRQTEVCQKTLYLGSAIESIIFSKHNWLAVGRKDGRIDIFKPVPTSQGIDYIFHWSSSASHALSASQCNLTGAQDLSQPNRQFFHQLGVINKPGLLTPVELKPTEAQIQAYLERYIGCYPEKTIDQYQEGIRIIPGLLELINTSHLLQIAVEALPWLLKDFRQTKEMTPIVPPLTRAHLFKAFLHQWIMSQDMRLKINPVLGQLAEPKSVIYDFLQSLALKILANSSSTSTEVSISDASLPLAIFLSESHIVVPSLYQSNLLIRISENQFSFAHLSFLEYFIACSIWEALILPQTADNARRLVEKGVNPNFILKKPAVINFLKDFANQYPACTAHFFIWIQRTRDSKSPIDIQASACAATLLNALQEPFNQTDLQGVDIAGADLTGALLRGSQLQRANLSGARLRAASLNETQLQGAILRDTEYGQGPIVQLEEVVRCIACHPIFPLIAIASGKNIILWDSAQNKLKNTLQTHTGTVYSVAFSSDGKLLASGGEDSLIVLWNIQAEQPFCLCRGHKGPIKSVTFSSDRNILISGGFETKSLRFWNVQTGHEIKTFGYSDPITSMSLSPDGKILALGNFEKGFDHSLRLCETLTGREICSLNNDMDSITSMAFSPDGKTLAVGSWDETFDKSLRFWDVATKCETHSFSMARGKVTSIVFSPDGKLLATADHDGSLQLWDVPTKSKIRSYYWHKNFIRSLVFSTDGKILISGGDDKYICFWDITMLALDRDSEQLTAPVVGLAFSHDSQILAASDLNHSLRLLHVSTGNTITSCIGHTGLVLSVAFSAHKKILASGSEDKSIRLWDILTGTPICSFLGHTECVNVVAFSFDGKILASGSDDKFIRLWNIETKREIQLFRGHTDEVYSVAFSPDGLTLFSGGKDRSARLWNVQTGLEVLSFPDHTDVVSSVTFNPDGKFLLSAGGNSIRCWDLLGREMGSYLGHTDDVTSIVFRPDGQYFASGSEDKTIRIWNRQTRECIQILHFGVSILKVAFSSQGHLAAGRFDGRIDIFIYSPQQQSYILQRSTASSRALVASHCNLTSARDLSSVNRQLLQKLGAVGEPV